MVSPIARFVAPKGFLLCYKCAGDGEHEIGQRDENGWPIGGVRRETCRHRGGDGLIEQGLINVPVEPPVEKHIGWGNYSA